MTPLSSSCWLVQVPLHQSASKLSLILSVGLDRQSISLTTKPKLCLRRRTANLMLNRHCILNTLLRSRRNWISRRMMVLFVALGTVCYTKSLMGCSKGMMQLGHWRRLHSANSPGVLVMQCAGIWQERAAQAWQLLPLLKVSHVSGRFLILAHDSFGGLNER